MMTKTDATTPLTGVATTKTQIDAQTGNSKQVSPQIKAQNWCRKMKTRCSQRSLQEWWVYQHVIQLTMFCMQSANTASQTLPSHSQRWSCSEVQWQSQNQAQATQQQVAMQLLERAPISTHQPWPQPAAQSIDTDTEGIFFREIRTDACAFCAKPGHQVCGCPDA